MNFNFFSNNGVGSKQMASVTTLLLLSTQVYLVAAKQCSCNMKAESAMFAVFFSGLIGAISGAVTGAAAGGVGAIPGAVVGFIGGTSTGSVGIVGQSVYDSATCSC